MALNAAKVLIQAESVAQGTLENLDSLRPGKVRQGRRNVFRGQNIRFSHDGGLDQGVLQLANIPWPDVAFQK
mgnify:CR=1 FL=1